MAPKILSIVAVSDYTISTWLLLGASIQTLLVATLPKTISLLPPILFLTYRMLYSYLVATGRLQNPLIKDVIYGRQTWQIPTTEETPSSDPSNSSGSSIVVLVLAASWSHPNGSFSPGSKEMGESFMDMWAHAAAHRDTYGFLGNTPGLGSIDFGSRPDEQGKTVVFLSYWKTLEGLHKFAHSKTHMKGQMWWESGAAEKFSHIGIMHETYEVPAGNWENVFHNFRPFGIANAKYPVSGATETDSEGNEKETLEWVSGLREAKRKDWKTMLGRMGRKTGARGPMMQ
ncbi:hypothetical protein T440DRAFT_558167 [Plenodomus tracheiphilus IPT5]|uniref:Uncharacterized protein n=1 Tax=Plenodomus tracheiphilus IPT5 TaxID=1408161 RepID=A0A6A7AST3_9PLEO|nr:hypothetical protein T440DRAFT_558167 [Plenodomus tracheiphilus IPT5]